MQNAIFATTVNFTLKIRKSNCRYDFFSSFCKKNLFGSECSFRPVECSISKILILKVHEKYKSSNFWNQFPTQIVFLSTQFLKSHLESSSSRSKSDKNSYIPIFHLFPQSVPQDTQNALLTTTAKTFPLRVRKK